MSINCIMVSTFSIYNNDSIIGSFVTNRYLLNVSVAVCQQICINTLLVRDATSLLLRRNNAGIVSCIVTNATLRQIILFLAPFPK